MKLNKDYLKFILSAVRDNYSGALDFVDVLQKFIDEQKPTQEECTDFIHAEQLLRDEGFVKGAQSGKLIELYSLTWKGHELYEQLTQ
ncbi:hypothetical protein D3C77_670700 [compost metagenome]